MDTSLGLLVWLLLVSFPLAVLGDSSHPRHNPPPPPPPPTRSDPSSTYCGGTPPLTFNTTEVIQVVETEAWDGERWIGADTGRWTTIDGHSCVSPSDIEAPPSGKFEGSWKIVLGDDRDNYGWSYIYYYMSRERPRRQRIWLRTVQLSESSAKEIQSRPFLNLQRKSVEFLRFPSLTNMSRSPTVQALCSIPAKAQLLPTLLQSAKDDWNFKGFGFSFYKSFLFKRSFGLAFRIPLTANWDLWDRHPELPRFSMNVAFFHPFTAMVSIGGSLNVEWIKWCVVQGYIILRHAIALCLLSCARGSVLAGSALAFPVTGQLYQLPDTKALLPPLDSAFRRKPTFSTTLQERVGVSYSWRISAKRGYEFRRTIWHLCLPTLLSLLQHADEIQQTCQKLWQKNVNPNTRSTTRYLAGFVPQSVRRRSSNYRPLQQSSAPTQSTNKATAVSLMDIARNNKGAEWWLQRKTGSLGVSTGYPIPDKPHFSCSAVLSLSGFYFRPDSVVRSTFAKSVTSGATSAVRDPTPILSSPTALLPEKESQEDTAEAALASSALRKTTSKASTPGETSSAAASKASQGDVKVSSASKTASA